MTTSELLHYLKQHVDPHIILTDNITTYKITYEKNLDSYDNDRLSEKLKADYTVFENSQCLVLWNAYCIGHDLEVAKQRTNRIKVDWETYLQRTFGGKKVTKSYANKLICFYSLCNEYKILKCVKAPISHVIDRITNIRDHLTDHEEDAAWWKQEPNQIQINSDSDEIVEIGAD